MSKEIQLTQGRVALVDDEDFDELTKLSWCLSSRSRPPYATTNIKISGKYRTVDMHRYLLNPPRGVEVDHINGNGLDNRRSNLRICTHAQNTRNKRSTPRSGFKGVSLGSGCKKSWTARIRADGIDLYLGSFPDPVLAASAYNKAALKYYGEFACLNVLD
jgi:hypothetical protein